MKQQNYDNHKRMDPKFHFVFTLLVLVVLICAIINLIQVMNQNVNPLSAIVLLLISVLFTLVVLMIRTYPLKAQDRAIMAEEGLRHLAITGKRLDTSLTRSQIIALRFAGDAEFPALCKKAAAEKWTSEVIKKAIVSWRADPFRI
ncbi:MAG: DUF6526 family protein [Paenibacillaceae bacterium]